MAIFKKNVSLNRTENNIAPKHTILLVDDEPDNLNVLTSILETHYHVLRAGDGQEALELVRQWSAEKRITLVISDQRMPRVTGVQLCEQLCELSPNTIRIIVTGYIDVDAIVDAVNRAQIYRFIIKPFDRNDFILTVQRAIEASEMQQQLDDYIHHLEDKVAERTQELAQRNTQLQTAYAELERLSTTDTLTGLCNRRYLHSVIEKDVALACRHYDSETGAAITGDQDLVFFLIDCDHFKSVNDEYGHDVGDRLLVAIADILRKTFRESDYLVRWGGEEFLVVARFTSRQGAGEMAERLRRTMAAFELTLHDNIVLRRTISIGYAAMPFQISAPKALEWPHIINLADCALYCAKHSGRNAWVGLHAVQDTAPLTPPGSGDEIRGWLKRGILRAESCLPLDSLQW